LTRQIIKARVAAGLPDFPLLRGSHPEMGYLTFCAGVSESQIDDFPVRPQQDETPPLDMEYF